jgi:hypothetical protein
MWHIALPASLIVIRASADKANAYFAIVALTNVYASKIFKGK